MTARSGSATSAALAECLALIQACGKQRSEPHKQRQTAEKLVQLYLTTDPNNVTCALRAAVAPRAARRPRALSRLRAAAAFSTFLRF